MEQFPISAPILTVTAIESLMVFGTTPSLDIQRSGYITFSTWDHHTAWLDVDVQTTLDTPHKHNSHRFSGCRLQLSHPASVRRYLEHLVPAIQTLQLLPRMRVLNQSIKSTMSATQQAKLEA